MKNSIGWFLAALLFLYGAAASAQVAPTITNHPGNFRTATWEALTENDTGAFVDSGTWRGIKTVQIVVTAQAGESVTIQGSNDGATWFTLTAVSLSSGVYLSLSGITASAGYTIIEDPRFIRPVMTNVGGSGADFDVILGGVR